MIEESISISLIAGIIDAGRRLIGEEAIKLANDVAGLSVKANGEIIVTGDCSKITGDLCRAFEKALRGNLVIDIVVRLNLLTNRSGQG